MLTISAAAIEISKMRQKRTALNKESKILGEQIEEKVIVLLAQLDDAGVKSMDDRKAGKIVTTLSVQPIVDNWQKFCKYVRRNNAFELIQQRPHQAACKERIEKSRGKGIPGIDTIDVRNVRITPLK